jgi:hypothetical protein
VTGKEFQKLIDRDGGGCLCCGETEAIAPNHRSNRGMGGARKDSYLNKPSNLVTLCSLTNGAIESNAVEAARAIKYGWKVSKYTDPKTVPVFDAKLGRWYLLDDSHGRHPTDPPAEKNL